MSTLPEEVSELTQLETIDISNNSFISLPTCLFTAPKITAILAAKNFVAELDMDLVVSSPKLEELDVQENPLSRESEEKILAHNESSNVKVKIMVSQREKEDWEDLDDV